MRIPAVGARSFTPIGTPRNGASLGAESTSRAVSSAWSATTVTKAVEGRIEALDLLERRADELDRRDLSGAHEPRLLDGREERELHRRRSYQAGHRPSIGTLGEMSRSAVARDHAAERLELLDWKRRVFDLYRSIRADPDPTSAWDTWRDRRDEMISGHRQSPLDSRQRVGFTPGYYDYDPPPVLSPTSCG